MIKVVSPLKRLRHGLLFILGLCFSLNLAFAAPAQSAREIAWEDLQPAAATIQDPMGHLPPEQYSDMSRLARLHWWIETGEVSADGPDAQQAEQLTETLTKQGVDVEGVLANLDAAREQWLHQSESINPELDGRSVKLAGFVLPLGGTTQPLPNSGHDEARVRAAQAERQRSSQPSTGGDRPSGFLLVPYVGACIHVPPPAPNQMVYVEPGGSQGELEAGLFDRVWIEGSLRRQPDTYSLFLVDGVREVSASYALELQAISPYIPEGTGLFDFSSGFAEDFSGSWLSPSGWQMIQTRASALVTGAMVGMRDRRSTATVSIGVLIAFAYGVIHTLGPGHGKALIVSYFVGQGGSLRKGVGMGLRVAVFHVFSAIVVAVLTDVIVRQAVGSAPGSYRLVRLVSYGAIAAIGARMLWSATQPSFAEASPAVPPPSSGTFAIASPQANLQANLLSPNLTSMVLEEDNRLNLQHSAQTDCGCYGCIDPQRSGGWLSLAIGAVPCSGALLVLIYGLANDLLWPAVLMVVAISGGMAIALSGIGVAAIWGRQWAERRMAGSQTSRRQAQFFQLLRIAGAVCVLVIGMFLFGFTLSSPTLPMLALASGA